MMALLFYSTASDRMMGSGPLSSRIVAAALVLAFVGALHQVEDYLTEEHYVLLAFCAVAYYALDNQGMLLKGAGKKKKMQQAPEPIVDCGTTSDRKCRADLAADWRNAACEASDAENEQPFAKDASAATAATPAMKYNIRIRNAIKVRDMELALKIFGEMKKAGVAPDLVSHNSLIHGYATMGELATAEKWFAKLLEADLCPDVCSFAPLVRGYFRRGQEISKDGDFGEAWLRKMRDSGVVGDCALLNLALEYLSKNNETAKVDMLLFQMLEDGPAPDTASFNAAMKAWTREGKVDRVEAWFKRMEARKVPTDFHSYQSLISAFGKAGKLEQAAETLKKMAMAGVPPHVSCYNALLQAFGDAKEFEKLWELFQKMKDRGVEPTAQTYANLLRPFSFAGDLPKVDQVLKTIREDGLNPLTEVTILQQWVTAYSHVQGSNAHAQGSEARKPALRIIQDAVAEGTQIDQPLLSALERAVGSVQTQALILKLNLRDHGWTPARESRLEGVKGSPTLKNMAAPKSPGGHHKSGLRCALPMSRKISASEHKIIRCPLPGVQGTTSP